MMTFKGTSIRRYLSLFEQCLDLPPSEASSIVAGVRTHLADAVDRRPDLRGEAQTQATRLLGSPRELAARLTIARLQGRARSSWWAATAWRRWRAALRAPTSRLGAVLVYLGPMAFVQFGLPRGGWPALTFLALLAGLVITGAISSRVFARLTRREAVRLAVAATAVSVVASAIVLLLAIPGVLSGNTFALVFWPVALAMAIAGCLNAIRKQETEVLVDASGPTPEIS